MSECNIKQIRTYIVTEDTDEEGLPHIVETYNISGHLIIQEMFEDGELTQTIERDYDEEGNIIGEYIYTDSDDPDQVMLYGKDSRNNHVLIEMSYADGSASHYHYDLDGDTETITVTDDDGNLEHKEVKKRDEIGNLTAHFEYNEANKLVSSSVLTYDENERVATSVVTDAEGRRTSLRYEYTMDEETGRVTGVDAYDEKGKIMRADTFEFDESGNLVAIYTEDSHRGIRGTELNTYDDQNRLVRTQLLDENDLPRQEITHLYNQLGQVIEKEVRTPLGVVLYRNEFEFFGR